jgi:aminopeptidase YwaD
MSHHRRTKIRKEDIAAHLDILCNRIGNRYSGSKGEKLAAEYIAEKMRGFGLRTEIQPFKFLNWIPKRINATLIKGREETRIPNVGPFLYSPSTKEGGVVGDIVYIESNLPAFFRKTRMKGKIGLNIGAFEIADPEIAQRIMDSGLEGMMTVDDRIPFPWRVPIGQAPQWSENYSIPTVAVPYMRAIELVRLLPARARLEIDAWSGMEESWNVVGEITGCKYPEDIIVVCAHTDSVLYNTGADDNASGCAFVLELARHLAGQKPARTVRFISYGVEEKLSVGAYMYMRSIEKTDAKKIVFCLNADSIGGRIGQNTALCTGTPEMREYLRRQFDRLDYAGKVRDEVNPYSDHFPLNICGVPSVWVTRLNLFNESYWTLHSAHDNLRNISLDVCQETISVWKDMLFDLTSKLKMPFPRRISQKLMGDVRKVAKVSYRHPWNPKL